mmetsp:Transcript_7053/g.12572  ORF Transcript_7053/g.12572 Transcript_7053/m.12572 type:complete len:82 (-) Transcript_7053:2454-2699(-)
MGHTKDVVVPALITGTLELTRAQRKRRLTTRANAAITGTITFASPAPSFRKRIVNTITTLYILHLVYGVPITRFTPNLRAN